jgi:hypothetical protein
MLTLHQFARYSTGAKYQMVTGLGTYLYSVPSKKGLINIYLLYGFIVEVSKDAPGNNVLKVDAAPAHAAHKKYSRSAISLN